MRGMNYSGHLRMTLMRGEIYVCLISISISKEILNKLRVNWTLVFFIFIHNTIRIDFILRLCHYFRLLRNHLTLNLFVALLWWLWPSLKRRLLACLLMHLHLLPFASWIFNSSCIEVIEEHVIIDALIVIERIATIEWVWGLVIEITRREERGGRSESRCSDSLRNLARLTLSSNSWLHDCDRLSAS